MGKSIYSPFVAAHPRTVYSMVQPVDSSSHALKRGQTVTASFKRGAVTSRSKRTHKVALNPLAPRPTAPTCPQHGCLCTTPAPPACDTYVPVSSHG